MNEWRTHRWADPEAFNARCRATADERYADPSARDVDLSAVQQFLIVGGRCPICKVVVACRDQDLCEAHAHRCWPKTLIRAFVQRPEVVIAVDLDRKNPAVVVAPDRRCELCGTEGDAVTCPTGHPDLRTVYPGIEGLRPWPVPGSNVEIAQFFPGEVAVNVRHPGGSTAVNLPIRGDCEEGLCVLAWIQSGLFEPSGLCDALVMSLFHLPGYGAEPAPEFNHWDPEYC